ncbi:hypothetical protein [Bradyrhizobium genosp. A]|uniref:hypothetical protein n=1 Tax=Bradyrhizobium genosp. A TaxID=83626 RepID=UPI003CEF71E7
MADSAIAHIIANMAIAAGAALPRKAAMKADVGKVSHPKGVHEPISAISGCSNI